MSSWNQTEAASIIRVVYLTGIGCILVSVREHVTFLAFYTSVRCANFLVMVHKILGAAAAVPIKEMISSPATIALAASVAVVGGADVAAESCHDAKQVRISVCVRVACVLLRVFVKLCVCVCVCVCVCFVRVFRIRVR
jgi:hypothetical protein